MDSPLEVVMGGDGAHNPEDLALSHPGGVVDTAELVMRAQRGDHGAFERLAAASIDRLYALAHRVIGDSGAAEDAVQETLVRAWRDIRALRDPDRWDAWLYRVLVNACRDSLRRKRRQPATISIAELDLAGGDDEVTRVDRRDELNRAFQRLTPEHRMALAMHFYLGMRPGEIALTLGIPEGTATSRIHYGGRALRAALDLEGSVQPTRGDVQ